MPCVGRAAAAHVTHTNARARRAPLAPTQDISLAARPALGEANGDQGGASYNAEQKQEAQQETGFWKYQMRAYTWYSSDHVQYSVAALIILNFLMNILEKEIDPSGEVHKGTWRALEHAFNACFLAELLVNMYANWLWPFWVSGWNQFDFVVVCVGCMSFFMELLGPLKLLRTLRAFRVFRLFKRIKSLNMIIRTIVSAIPGVANAFLVMVLAISIYALIGVEFFFEFGTSNSTTLTGAVDDGAFDPAIACAYRNIDGDIVEAVSSRQLCAPREALHGAHMQSGPCAA